MQNNSGNNVANDSHGRKGKRVSFPNLEMYSEDDDWKSQTKDDVSESQSVASR